VTADLTDADRARALALLEKITFGGYGQDSTVEMTAQALADERERAVAPFLALADDLDDGSEWATFAHAGYVVARRIRAAAQEDPK
jgi:hypothetical protein